MFCCDQGETLTDLMVEEFELEGAVASAAELSPTPQLSISLIEGLPGRAMVTYPVRTAAGDAGTAVALWDVAGKRPLARWEVGVPQSSTTPNVSSPCPGAFPPRSLTWDWFCQAPWILGKTGLVDTEQDELLVAAVGTPAFFCCYLLHSRGFERIRRSVDVELAMLITVIVELL